MNGWLVGFATCARASCPSAARSNQGELTKLKIMRVDGYEKAVVAIQVYCTTIYKCYTVNEFWREGK